jgi:hypothetical protein
MRKTTKGQRRKAPVLYMDFVKAWVTSSTIAEVGKKVGVSGPACSRIAFRLRKAGVDLKQFPRRHAQPIDVKALNKQIRS